MSLWLTVEVPTGERRDVAITVAPSCPVGRLLDELAGYVGRQGGRGTVEARNHRTLCWLDRGRTVGEEDLLRGDVLTLEARAAAPSPVAAPRDAGSGAAVPTGREGFNRPPRVVPSVPPLHTELAAPPELPRGRRFPLGAALIPLIMGVGLFAVTGYPQMLLVALFSPMMAIWSFLDDRFSGRSDFADRRKRFFDELARARDRVTEHNRAEEVDRRSHWPDPSRAIAIAVDRTAALWERRPKDVDFLELRIGIADQLADASVTIKEGGAPTLRDEADRWLQGLDTVAEVPATFHWTDAGVVGLAGSRPATTAFSRWLLAQLVIHHSPADVVVATALAEDAAPEWEWLRWLPHCEAAGSPLSEDQLRVSADGARDLFARVGDVLAERRSAGGRMLSGRVPSLPCIVVVIDERLDLERSVVTDLLVDGPDHGIYCLWLGEEERLLPGECGVVISVDTDGRASRTRAASGVTDTGIAVDGMGHDDAERAARALSPLLDLGARQVRRRIPASTTLPEILDFDPFDPAAVRECWTRFAPSVRARIGAGADGPVAIDFSRDPHLLVAGTTGSGKSELLQSLIASLALAYPPTRVAFVLVDYKGGAAFKDVARLPHTAGLVTDLDPHLTRRALIALDAEIKQRESLFRKHGVQEIAELERTAPADAPPHFLIIVDEFATLAKELPEFVAGVVSLAQRGRTLGLHVILATQRPAGVVTDNIRANVSVRIALRVTDDNESRDVVDVTDAARIPRSLPGRAFVRLEQSSATEFQAAYVGGATAIGDRDAVVVEGLPPFGRSADRRPNAHDGDRDLVRFVDVASDLVPTLGIRPTPSPWPEPLPSVIPVESLGTPTTAARVARIGLVDEPSRQRQRPLDLDLERHGNVLVYGTARSGKTTLLRVLAAGLAAHASPEELQVYGLDFGARGLAVLESLPHCGAVVADDEPARVARLFWMLRDEIDRRRDRLARAGVASIDELQAREGRPVARIVLLLDGYAGFVSAFERLDFGRLLDLLPTIVRDGPSVGVHVVITADRRAVVPGALSGSIASRIVLRVADLDEFASLGVDLDLARGASLPTGRGFVGGNLEFHTAILGSDPGATAQQEMVRTLGASLCRRWPTGRVPAVEVLPDVVDARALDPPSEAWAAVVGIDDERRRPALLGFGEANALVAGPPRSGRSNTLAVIASSLAEGTPGLQLHLLAPRPSPLTALDVWSSVARGEDCDAAAQVLADLVDARQPAVADAPILVVVDDAEELTDNAARTLETVARRGRDRAVRVVVAAETRASHHAYGGVVFEVKRAKRGLLLQPDVDIDGDLFGVRLPRSLDPARPPGRGFLVDAGVAVLVQVARV